MISVKCSHSHPSPATRDKDQQMQVRSDLEALGKLPRESTVSMCAVAEAARFAKNFRSHREECGARVCFPGYPEEQGRKHIPEGKLDLCPQSAVVGICWAVDPGKLRVVLEFPCNAT